MGVLLNLTKEYFGETGRAEEATILKVDFTDKNGKFHKKGYRAVGGSSEERREKLEELIDQLIKERGLKCDLNDVDVSMVDDMSGLFYNSEFDGDISGWDVSNVTNMCEMFYNSPFNGNIKKWDVGRVENMNGMFSWSSFNNDIGDWNVSSVSNMKNMFKKSIFNKEIGKWNVGKVTNMSNMFDGSIFNKDINEWNVRRVENMTEMFNESDFNQDLNKWKLDNLKKMDFMFFASSFNKDINEWDVKNVKEMKDVFGKSPLAKNPPKWYDGKFIEVKGFKVFVPVYFDEKMFLGTLDEYLEMGDASFSKEKYEGNTHIPCNNEEYYIEINPIDDFRDDFEYTISDKNVESFNKFLQFLFEGVDIDSDNSRDYIVLTDYSKFSYAMYEADMDEFVEQNCWETLEEMFLEDFKDAEITKDDLHSIQYSSSIVCIKATDGDSNKIILDTILYAKEMVKWWEDTLNGIEKEGAKAYFGYDEEEEEE